MATVLDVMRANGGFVELASRDEYAKYFNHMSRALAMVKAWYWHLIEGGNTDARHTEVFLNKLLFNIEKWRDKYLYDASHGLPVHLNKSGFPNLYAFLELGSDLSVKSEKTEHMTSEEQLIRAMIQVMLQEHRDPIELMMELSQNKYFASIDKDKVFMTFTPGQLQLAETRVDCRKYLFSWAYFDASTNLPYLHLMAFDQDIEEEPLEVKGEVFNQFVKTIERQSLRVVSVCDLASTLDDNIKSIHPKVLKRVRVGPIVCPRFSRESDPEPLMALLKEFGEEGDFAVKLMSEIVQSGRQEKRSVPVLDFGRSKKVQEIFAIPRSDLRCLNQRASHVFDNLILPHRVLQQAVNDPRFAQYAKMGQIVYNQKGDLYVV